ncbi:MAG: hypothetical protein IB617_02540 [Candidatus Nealsonbacteria bacterium]|nr:MAG: hypothetical protein IB617_02540 [Candidatus Nealsonbacteria bacterium]
MKTKTLIILIILIGLGIGGFFVYKNIFVADTEKTKEEKAEEEVYIYKGAWMPTLLLQDPNYLASNIQKLKDLGINTIFIAALSPLAEPDFERIREVFSPELLEKLKEILPVEKELIINNIQTVHRNGLKVALTVGDPPVPENVDLEALNSRIIEVAKLAEEYDVELFTPLNEPEKIFKKNIGVWRQEILLKIKEVYNGEVAWNGAMPGFPDKESISKTPEQPPGDFAGYDYIGFGSMLMSEQTLEEYSESVEGALDFMLAKAERDGCKGVIITEFGVLMGGPWNEEEIARAYEIVLEKGKDKVVGFFAFRFYFLEVDLPGFFIEQNPKTKEVIKRWFTEILD